jgi:two-component system nitrate/nitrite response regulator NarL
MRIVKIVDGRVRPAQIVIASSDAKLRAALRAALRPDSALQLCAEESSAAAAVSAAVLHQAALCIVDDTVDGGTVAITADLSVCLPETKVIALVSDPRPHDLRAHVRVGVAGYLPRTMNMKRLPHIACAVLLGGAAVPRGLMTSLVADFRDNSARRRPIAAPDLGGRLTSREWQILELLRQEQSTREIAGRLYISEVTVRTHVASILRKLGLPDRAALCQVDQGLDRADAGGLARAS